MHRSMSRVAAAAACCACVAACADHTAPLESSTPSSAGGSGSTAAESLTQLPSLGGRTSFAEAINDRGEVAGESQDARGNLTAVLWDGGTVRSLGTLGGPESTANQINPFGLVVGASSTATGGTDAFLWTLDHGLADLGSLGGNYSSGLGVNAEGIVVGASTDSGGTVHAFLWSRHTGMRAITGASSDCLATGVNDWIQVVGDCTSAELGTTAFIAEGGRQLITLGGLGGPFAVAWAISNTGLIVGESALPSGVHHAVEWRGARARAVDLGTLGGQASFAYAVSDAGEIAGAAEDASGALHAVRWNVAGVIADLGIAGDAASVAYGINNGGATVGGAIESDGRSSAVVWTRQPGAFGDTFTASPLAAATAINAPPSGDRRILDYRYASRDMLIRLGVHAGSASAMRVLTFGPS